LVIRILLLWGRDAERQAVMAGKRFNLSDLQKYGHLDSKGEKFWMNYKNGMRYFRNRITDQFPTFCGMIGEQYRPGKVNVVRSGVRVPA
jgi:hypothetical protein